MPRQGVDDEEVVRLGKALHGEHFAVLELDTGSRHPIPHRTRSEQVARPGLCRYPSTDMRAGDAGQGLDLLPDTTAKLPISSGTRVQPTVGTKWPMKSAR